MSPYSPGGAHGSGPSLSSLASGGLRRGARVLATAPPNATRACARAHRVGDSGVSWLNASRAFHRCGVSCADAWRAPALSETVA